MSAVQSITLPKTNSSSDELHIFAISMSPSSIPSGKASGPELSIRRARFTTRWDMVNNERAQAVEVTLANLLPSYTLSRNTSVVSQYELELSGSGVQTVSPGAVYRLVPADQVRIDVLITTSKTNGNATVQIKDTHGNIIGTSAGWPVTPLVENWTADPEVLSTHETPTWVSSTTSTTFALPLKLPLHLVEPSQVWHIVSFCLKLSLQF